MLVASVLNTSLNSLNKSAWPFLSWVLKFGVNCQYSFKCQCRPNFRTAYYQVVIPKAPTCLKLTVPPQHSYILLDQFTCCAQYNLLFPTFLKGEILTYCNWTTSPGMLNYRIQVLGFIKGVDKVWITTVENLERWRFERYEGEGGNGRPREICLYFLSRGWGMVKDLA